MNNQILILKIQYYSHSTKKKSKKYSGIKPTKYVHELYEENNKTLMKEIKDINTWRAMACP